jgi:hypothetical protein
MRGAANEIAEGPRLGDNVTAGHAAARVDVGEMTQGVVRVECGFGVAAGLGLGSVSFDESVVVTVSPACTWIR